MKRLHFLDSGAFTLFTTAIQYQKNNKCGRWDYYHTDEFWEYMDGYAAFVKKYKKGIDYYANLDVIKNPELTWRNQKYLEEKHNLSPVPVVHFREDLKLKWLKQYIDLGYDMIGLGGVAKTITARGAIEWFDCCFDVICDTPDRLPKTKIHGFGISSIKWWLRFPWYSIDSTSIHKKSGFGWILVPYLKDGYFDFTKPGFHLSVSDESPLADFRGRHYKTLTPLEKENIMMWLDFIKVPLGNSKEIGITNDGNMRKIAIYRYYEHIAKALPKWPWPFKRRRGTLV